MHVCIILYSSLHNFKRPSTKESRMKGSKPFTTCAKLLGLDLGTWKFSLSIVHMLQPYQICTPCNLRMKGSKPCTACAKLLGLDLGFELGTWKNPFLLYVCCNLIKFVYIAISCDKHVFFIPFMWESYFHFCLWLDKHSFSFLFCSFTMRANLF